MGAKAEPEPELQQQIERALEVEAR
jgi:hypothetical protein